MIQLKFDLAPRKPREFYKTYPKKEYDLATQFAKELYKEFGDFIRGIILFGSITKGKKKVNDIDILVILDDVKVQMSKELTTTYRVIAEKTIAKVDPKKLHVQSMTFTSFWEYVRAGDPVAINILRHGLALIDTGFFDPLQTLLDEGRIRPSKESVYTYFYLAPSSLHKATQHLLTAGVDLYWACINASHSALMAMGEVPPSPDHVYEMLIDKMVKPKLITEKDAFTMKKMYDLFKDISHRKKEELKGFEYDKLRKEAEAYVKKMEKFVEKKMKTNPF